jgi:CMP-N,N'-diacetyllegionaminic acid synthase
VNVLGIIPARGGSKSIPHKNLVPLAGKPLIGYTCEAARSSRRLSRVILSTDDPAIVETAKSFEIEAPFLRPTHLSEDDTPMVEVIHHALDWLATVEKYCVDVIVLLQPTSPLRRAEHIDAAVDLLFGSNADTVVSVTHVPHQFNPVSVMRLDSSGYLRPFIDGPMVLRRQDKPKVFARNGPAVLVTRRAEIEAGQLYGERVKGYEMDAVDSVDIDEPANLTEAEFWLAHRKAGRQ